MTNKALHIALIGGIDREYREQVPERIVSVSPVGGAALDLRDFDHDVTVVKVSVAGGVRLRVPAHVTVEVSGVAFPGVFGRRVEPGKGGPTVRVHRYGLFGGVEVVREG
jgi:hypothetical protein